jgi:hypothetical protein
MGPKGFDGTGVKWNESSPESPENSLEWLLMTINGH